LATTTTLSTTTKTMPTAVTTTTTTTATTATTTTTTATTTATSSTSDEFVVKTGDPDWLLPVAVAVPIAVCGVGALLLAVCLFVSRKAKKRVPPVASNVAPANANANPNYASYPEPPPSEYTVSNISTFEQQPAGDYAVSNVPGFK
jgi:hypothetical protein